MFYFLSLFFFFPFFFPLLFKSHFSEDDKGRCYIRLSLIAPVLLFFLSEWWQPVARRQPVTTGNWKSYCNDVTGNGAVVAWRMLFYPKAMLQEGMSPQLWLCSTTPHGCTLSLICTPCLPVQQLLGSLLSSPCWELIPVLPPCGCVSQLQEPSLLSLLLFF